MLKSKGLFLVILGISLSGSSFAGRVYRAHGANAGVACMPGRYCAGYNANTKQVGGFSAAGWAVRDGNAKTWTTYNAFNGQTKVRPTRR